MKKYTKLIGKVVFGLVMLILLIQLIQLTIKEQIITESKTVKQYDISQEDIVSSGMEIVIKSFSDIENLKWIDHDKLLIVGTINDVRENYIFDLNESELMIYKDQIHPPSNYGDYEVIQDIPNYGLLCISGTGIGLLKDNTFEVIADDASYNGSVKYKLSKDLTKLLYYRSENETIVVYNFKKDFYRTIKAEIDDRILSNFEEQVKISPLGGYVSVEYREDIVEDSNFSIFGADSGKLYANDVYGMYLSWSNDEDKVCYYYSKESEAIDGSIDHLRIGSHRVGYYDVSSKKINYIESSSHEEWMLSQIYWSDNRITMLAGEISDGFKLNKVISYDFEVQQYDEWLINLEPLPSGIEVELIDYEDTFILLVEGKDENDIYRIEKNSKELIPYDDLTRFDTIEASDLYFYKNNNKYITADKEKVIISTETSQRYIPIEGSYYIVPSSQMDYVAVWFMEMNEIVISVTN